MKLLDRFLRYVSIDTQSDPTSDAFPSTPGQLTLLALLASELSEMGAEDVAMDTNGYVTATIPASPGCEAGPTIGFLAHVDTSPDAPGANVRPQLIDYEGGYINVDGEGGGGNILITSDGTTLLGADDKAGVAEIMTAADILLHSLDIQHVTVRIAFTPDEEIGRGVDRFDVAGFGADWAYTIDGGAEGELEFENFNAAAALIEIRGRSAHPGDAKGQMINALRVAMDFDAALPSDERPESTEGYEGFYHLLRMEGGVAAAQLEYFIRDHDRTKFESRKNRLKEIAAELDGQHGAGTVNLCVSDQYYNMREVLEHHPEVIERARRAMLAVGVEPRVKPIRGGTDGARLSFMGLPCPNIFTGGTGFHSLNERVSLRAMHRAVDTIIEIAKC